MTRELNVRITLDIDWNDISNDEIEDVLAYGFGTWFECDAQAKVHTVTPESANPKEGECKNYEPKREEK